METPRVQISIDTVRGVQPFWAPALTTVSDRLWLPTMTAPAASPSPCLSAGQPHEVPSWFSIQTKSIHQDKDPSTSFTYSVAGSTENVERPPPKKQKTDKPPAKPPDQNKPPTHDMSTCMHQDTLDQDTDQYQNVGNYTPQEECPSIKPQKGTKNVEIEAQSDDIPSEIEVCLKQKATFLKCQETKKRKRSEREEKTKAGARVRTFKVRLYPTSAQKKTLRVFFGHARYTYNTVVNAVKKLKEEGMAVRRAKLKDTLVTHPSEPWLKDVPVYPREGAFDDFFIAQKSANTNKQRGNIKEYNFKYRSKRDPRESIRIRGDCGSSFKYGVHEDDGNKRSRSKNGSSYAVFNPDELGKKGILMKTTSHVRRLGDKPTSDMRLVRTRDDKYWLCVTVQRDEIMSKDFLGDARAPIVALDPGVRTFLTAYDTEGNVHDIGITEDITRLCRLGYAIDKNKRKIQAIQKVQDIQKMEKERRPKTPGSKSVSSKHAQPTAKERKLENKNLCLFRRMKNMTDDIHWKVIRFLCNRYKIILLPKFNAKNCMVKIMSKKNSRTAMQWSHCRFMDRLKWKAGHLDTTVLVNGEAYTSVTCGRCGEEHEKLGRKKTFVCPKCRWTADRDANGARNILLRSVGNATVSKDGLDALVMEVDEVHERVEFETKNCMLVHAV